MLITKGPQTRKNSSKRKTIKNDSTITDYEKSISDSEVETAVAEHSDGLTAQERFKALIQRKLTDRQPDQPTIVWDGSDSDDGLYYRKL
jgi:hypothetical protein